MTEPRPANCTSPCIACMTDESHDPTPAPLSPCRRIDRHNSHVHEVYRRPFLCPGVTERAEATASTADRLRALHRDAYADTADAGSSCSAGCGAWPCATIRILNEQPTTPLPTVEVWMVWREYEPVYACYATEDAAKLGTIDCWREEESSCPEYSWPATGARLELVAGDKPTGIYAIRTTVYGASQPTDRATVLREVVDRLDRLGLRDLATRELRRMADEAEAGGAR
ncbi:hypothetical protein G3I34_21785 [Streptomyces sp. SID8014]|uniref:hypothetical protein n=1 Tax=Streptomyces sp. SID8014 TaxID=2706097 RepID=UPI0013BBF414|nr:hypothetical protein [Streptomyces sp. SID8014]NEC14849.1 hypothetical protein [Streptomyces sp. SID8014]